MSRRKIRRALISVYDKTGIVDFARTLHFEFGIEILSTGGTAKLLTENDIPVTLVEELTGVAEMMDGRVKTLHPEIHGAILADRDNPEHTRQLESRGIQPIDLVVVNLYPFERTVADPRCTFEQAIEMIDIGGPCMLRAAAKNHRHVLPIVSASQFDVVLNLLRKTAVNAEQDRQNFGAEAAATAFGLTRAYDQAVHEWLQEARNVGADRASPDSFRWGALRYGENPHQEGAIRPSRNGSHPVSVVPPEPGDWSYNNVFDADAAARLCNDLAREMAERIQTREPAEVAGAGCHSESQPAGRANGAPRHGPAAAICVLVKHTNACGTGISEDPIKAYERAYLGDPNAAMGGVLACSFDVNAEIANAVMNTYGRWGDQAGAGGFFLDVWIAPSFDAESVQIVRRTKEWGKRVRLLAVGSMSRSRGEDEVEFRSISGGILRQTRDHVGLDDSQWRVATQREPTDQEMTDLRLAWLIAKNTKSNAISICKEGMLIGSGAGQMSRVMSCRIATWLAKENGHGTRLAASVAASDAYFPFSDGPTILMDAGVSAIIQPGGSKRDNESIKACDDRGVAMIFTGTRHFKH